MASNIESQINAVVSLLNRLSEAGRLTEKQLSSIATSVNNLNFTSTVSKDISAIIADLDLLSNKLQFTKKAFVPAGEKTFFRQQINEIKQFIPEYQRALAELESIRQGAVNRVGRGVDAKLKNQASQTTTEILGISEESIQAEVTKKVTAIKNGIARIEAERQEAIARMNRIASVQERPQETVAQLTGKTEDEINQAVTTRIAEGLEQRASAQRTYTTLLQQEVEARIAQHIKEQNTFNDAKGTGQRREGLQTLVDDTIKANSTASRNPQTQALIDAGKAQREYTRLLQAEVERRTALHNEEWAKAKQGVQAQKEFIESLRNSPRPVAREDFTELTPAIETGKTFKEQDFVSVFSSIPHGERALANLNEKLKEYNLSAESIKKVNADLGSGIRTVNLEWEHAAGITKTATVFLDDAGRIVERNQRGFRTFGDSLRRDVGEFLKWTIAATLILGPLQKLNELVQEAVEIQKLLADAQVATGISTEKLSTIFDQSSKIAEVTGSSVKGVVEGYSLAFAATGSIANEAERTATTQVLLRDSMILSKLAGIEQAKALDILVAGLRQTGKELTDSTGFLDSWVAVSKRANVNVETLATAYSVVGTAAADAGIDQDRLNGIIASLAESTGLSAEETANAVRGFISGISNDKAEAGLARYGIAVRDINGNLKDFITITDEIKAQQEAGLLDDKAMQDIANLIGGGFRQGSRVATYFETYGRALDLTRVSSEASGDAAAAFGIQLETLDTALTKLSSSFTTLAQAIGTKGGILDLIKDDIISPLQSFINLLTGLIEGLGKATPAIIAFASAMAFLGSATGSKVLDIETTALTKFATAQAVKTGQPLTNGLLSLFMNGGLNQTVGGVLGRVGSGVQGLGNSFDLGMSRIGRQTNLGSVNPIGYVAPALIAGSAVAEGDFGKAGTSIIGAIAGGIISAGNPLGIAAGSAMAASFYEGFVNYESDLAARWQELIIQGQNPPAETPEQTQANANTQLSESYSILQKFGQSSIAAILTGISAGSKGLYNLTQGGLGVSESVQLKPEDIVTSNFQLAQGGANVDSFFFKLVGQNLTDAQIELIKQIQILNSTIEDASGNSGVSTFTSRALTGNESLPGIGAKDYSSIFNPIGNSVADDLVSKVLGKYQIGQASSQEFKDARNVGQGLADKAGKTALALDLSGISYDAEQLTLLLSQLQTEEANYLNQIVSDLLDAKNTSVETRKAFEEMSKLEDPDVEALNALTTQATEAEAKIKDLQNLLQQFYPAAEQGNRIRSAEMLPKIDLGELNAEQSDEVRAKAEELYRNYLEQIANIYGLSDDDIEKIVEAGKESLIQIQKGIFDGTTKIPQEYFQQAIEDLGLEDASSGKDKNTPFQLLDYRDKNINSGQLQSVYQQMLQTITSQFPQYEVNAQDVGILFKDGFDTQHVDMTILNLAMQELIEVNKEQLNGVYNLPEGSTFFVPLTGYDLARSTVANQGGGGGFDPNMFGGTPSTTPDTTGEYDPYSYIDAQARRLANPGPPVQNVPENMALLNELRRYGMLPGTIPTPAAGEYGSKKPDLVTENTTQPIPTLKLNLDITSSFTVQLDGRTIATAIKNFLLDDLLRSEGTGGGITRRYVL